MEKKNIFIIIGIIFLSYFVFLAVMAVSGLNDVDGEVRHIVADLVYSGKFKLDETAGTATPVSAAARDEFGTSLVLYMRTTIQLKEKSEKGIIPYLNGDNIYYRFKCKRQEKVVIPFLLAILADKRGQSELDDDIVQKVLDSLDAPEESGGK